MPIKKKKSKEKKRTKVYARYREEVTEPALMSLSKSMKLEKARC